MNRFRPDEAPSEASFGEGTTEPRTWAVKGTAARPSAAAP
jgi:hypothetical protein